MTKRLAIMLGLTAALAIPLFGHGSHDSRHRQSGFQVFIGSFGSYFAWNQSHHRNRRFCQRNHHRKHRRFKRGCNACNHSRRYHGYYRDRYRDPYNDRFDRYHDHYDRRDRRRRGRRW